MQRELEHPLAPKPPVTLVALSVVVLAGCILLVSAAIAMLFVTWDPCSLIGGAVFLPLPAVLAVLQYRGTFRCSTRAAFMSAVMLFVPGGCALLAFAMTLGEMVMERAQAPWVPILLPMFATGVTGCLAAWVNLRWSRRLERAAPPDANASARTRFSLRELLIAVTAIACTAALVGYFVRSTPPQHAESVSRDMAPFALPGNAQRVSFCQGLRGTIAYEFSIDEGDFVEWVESGIGPPESNAAMVPIREITGTHTMRRYYGLSADLTGPDSITITNGLHYSWSKEDRGAYAAFDRTTGRAYYYAHSH